MRVSYDKKGNRGRVDDAPLSLMQTARHDLAGFFAKGRMFTFNNSTRAWRRMAELVGEEHIPAAVLGSLAPEPVPEAIRAMLEDGYVYAREPRQHQQDGFEQTRDWAVAALLMDAGTGKTKVALDTAAYLWGKGEINLVIVVAPSGVQFKWIDQEVPNDVPSWCPLKASAHSTSTLKDAAELIRNAIISGEPYLLAVNTEMLSNERAVATLLSLIETNRVLIIFDESTRFKNISSARGHNAILLARRCAYVRILTGTPVTRHVDDLYGQLKLLSDSVAGETTISGFKARFCEVDPNYKTVIGSRNLDDLLDALAKVSFMASKEDCLDLPPKTWLERAVKLTDEQRTHYNALLKHLVTTLRDGHELTVSNVLAQMVRLQQVCSGFLINPETKVVDELACKPRLDAVEEVASELRGKLVVWCQFRHETERLTRELKKMGLRVGRYDGSVSPAERHAILTAFQRTDELDCLVATMSSGGIGLDMTAASDALYYSHTFNAEIRWQSEARLDRIGQTRAVCYHDLVAPGTVDRRIITNVREKRVVAGIVGQGVKDRLSMILAADPRSSELVAGPDRQCLIDFLQDVE